MRTRILLVPALIVAACTPPKPAPATVAVAATADTLVVPVVSISEAVPRGDGTWVLLAPLESQVLVGDFAAKRVTPFPGIIKAEVPGPSALLGMGDTVVIGDWGLKRLTSWVAGAPRIAAWPLPDALGGAFPRTRDAAGQWYFEVAPPAKPDGSGLLDSAAIVRADPLLSRFDTVARLVPPEVAVTDAGNGRRYQARILSGRDAWGVYPDGTLWIARVFQNQVEWHQPGTKKIERSDRLPDPVLQMKRMDKEIWVRRFPEDQRTAASQLPFSVIKPPFEKVLAAPDGRLWLFKSDTALAPARKFQIVDRKAGLVLYVSVPSRGTPLGMTGQWIVMAEEFPGGIRLLRYPVPAEAKAP